MDRCRSFCLDARDERRDSVASSRSSLSVADVRHDRRQRRQDDSFGSNGDTASTILSILPLDRLGAIVGQIMSTGLKEMMNPNVGKKIVNVLENQAPSLLTSLFGNLLTNLRAPGRTGTSHMSSVTMPMNNSLVKSLSNSSTSALITGMRRPSTK
jgi:hypothetical protein